MRRRRRNYPHILWLVLFCVMLTGCADPDILDNIPRDFALSWGMTEEDSEEDKGEPSSEASSEEAEIPAVCFLMEEAGSFAHDSLSEAEQLWYHDMERILGSYGEEEELNTEGFDAGLDEADVDRIFQCVLSDHPELFYVEGYSYTKYTRGDRLTSIEFSGTYNMDVDTAAVRSEEILAAAEQILAGIDGNAGEYEKVKYVYDTIIRNTDYDMNAPDNQNIYSVFIHHASVCQGYGGGVYAGAGTGGDRGGTCLESGEGGRGILLYGCHLGRCVLSDGGYPAGGGCAQCHAGNQL